jgi:hypothetical protein
MQLFRNLVDLVCRICYVVGAIYYTFFVVPDDKALMSMLIIGVAVLIPSGKDK